MEMSNCSFYVLFLTAHVVLVVRCGEPCSNTCHWSSWKGWSDCSSSCGGGSQWRRRQLCCEQEWLEDKSCTTNCGKESTGYYDSRRCSMWCFNGGSIGGFLYRCTCPPGYSGWCCDIDIDECSSSPCLNNGTCTDKVNGYTCDCQFEFYGDNCETGICQPLPADVIFVLDSSASQTNSQFERQLEFVNKFISNVTVGPNDFRIAVITFSTNANIDFKLNAYSTSSSTQSAVSRIKFKPGVTYTDKGLRLVEEVLHENNGGDTMRPNGKTAKQYVMLLTDGLSNNRAATREAAFDIKNRVHKVIAIGVGPAVSHEELLDIASPGDKYTPQYVFSVTNFNSLHKIIEQLVHIMCEKCQRSNMSDIVVMLDKSVYMNTEDFEIVIQAITYLLVRASALGEEHGLRIGVASFNNELKTVLELNHGLAKEALLAKLQTLSLDGTCVDNNCGVNISEAIIETALGSFDETKGGRADAKRFLVVFSNGKFEEEMNSVAIINKLADNNVKLFVVGVGDSPNTKTLISLVADASQVFYAQLGVNPTNLDAMQSEFMYNIC